MTGRSIRHEVGVWLSLVAAGTALVAAACPSAVAGHAGAGDVDGRCPLIGAPTAVSARPGASTTLVPGGASSLLLCSYRGLNPPGQAHRLVGQRLLSAPAQVAGFARQFDELRPPPPLVSCPMDDGSEVVATFLYGDAPPDPVTVGLSGCEIASNGTLTRTASLPPGPALLGRLKALVPIAR